MSPTPRARPLEFFIDRSLGRHRVPDGLRALGMTVYTMSEVYGEVDAQRVVDEDWLRLCGERDWVALHKDNEIGRPIQGKPRRELQSLIDHRVRSFCIMDQSMTGTEMVARYARHQRRIISIAGTRTGPYLFGLYGDGMREIYPAQWRKRGLSIPRPRSADRRPGPSRSG